MTASIVKLHRRIRTIFSGFANENGLLLICRFVSSDVGSSPGVTLCAKEL